MTYGEPDQTDRAGRTGSGPGQSTGVDRQGMLKPEDKAPDFTLLNQHGQTFMLPKSRKRRLVLR